MKETKLLTRRVGKYDPLDLSGYKADGGLVALKRALSTGFESLIEEIRRSGLVGRGGAGFPTGAKWAMAAAEEQGPKYFICNAEEGELGTFKDKVLLEGDPWMVLEGILIAAFVIGAEQSYIYISSEYEKSIELWEKLVVEAGRAGLLGDGILGSKFSVDLQVVKGKGLYITGEEFALISSLEARRAAGRLKPPYPTEKGLFGRPTVVNNIETIANVPVILANGVEAYRRFGVEDEPGTRLFSLSGDVKKTGVYELEIGSGTLAEFINEFSGGTANGRGIKAVQPGGGTSALLAGTSLGCTLTTQAIRLAGSEIGTAGVMVYEDGRSTLDIVRGLMQFYGSESCGRCAPCRIGVVRMRDIVERLSQGEGTTEDLEQLRQIGKTCVAVSTCGMGQAFPIPVLSALELFPHDFEAAIHHVSA
ncbi:MAG: NADP oxidoreductase [Planctomycetota bacterium]|nr:MAG: NADP oxidoreductase [Planctomycetota bacterium]